MEDRIRASETDNNFIERLVAPVTRFKDVQTRVVVVVVASMELKFKLQTIDTQRSTTVSMIIYIYIRTLDKD